MERTNLDIYDDFKLKKSFGLHVNTNIFQRCKYWRLHVHVFKGNKAVLFQRFPGEIIIQPLTLSFANQSNSLYKNNQTYLLEKHGSVMFSGHGGKVTCTNLSQWLAGTSDTCLKYRKICQIRHTSSGFCGSHYQINWMIKLALIPYNAEIFLYKPWRPWRFLFNLKSLYMS